MYEPYVVWLSCGCRVAVVWLSYGCHRASMCRTVFVFIALFIILLNDSSVQKISEGQQGALSGEWKISAFPKPPVCFVHWRRTLASTWTRPDKLRPARVCVPLCRATRLCKKCTPARHTALYIDIVFVCVLYKFYSSSLPPAVHKSMTSPARTYSQICKYLKKLR